MDTTINEVLKFVKDNDVKFVRLHFCDLFGKQKCISIIADELPSAFKHGISFDAHAIKGFRDVVESDLFLHPDPTSLEVLPWRPGPGKVVRLYCDIKKPDGELYEHDSRVILQKVVERSDKMGLSCKVGAECEFYLFKTDEYGEPTDLTLDNGGYLDIAPLDRCGDIRREICLTLEGMGIKPQTSHHEQGPGQNEIDFKFDDALRSADNLQTFKSVVKTIASRNGLFASFMPKPIPGKPGNGMHVNLSISINGSNIFKDIGEGSSVIAESFIAGILEKAVEITAFLNPLTNSYERLGNCDAPKYISWSHQNRSQLIRIPAATGEKTRMELRSPDPAINPYLAFALIISAGLDGIEKKLSLPPAVDADLYTDETVTKTLTPLPDSLEKALIIAKDGEFVKSVVGEELLQKYISIKEAEINEYNSAKDKTVFDKEKYFTKI